MTSIYDFEMKSISGETVPLSNYRDKTLLIVNVASQCGLTPQYEGLCKLQQDHPDLQVLGFSCNQFGAQEPGTPKEILNFVQSRYNLNFPLFEKVEVNGENACPLYQWLTSSKPTAEGEQNIRWNFTKFLIDEKGQVQARFEPKVTPEEIAEQIKDR